MHILVIRVSAIGDVIHTLPAIFLLKNQFPHAKIHWVVQQKTAALLINQPFIEKVHVVPDKYLMPKHWSRTYNTIKELRQISWDAIIDFQGLIKTAAIIIPLRGKKYGFSAKHAREQISTLFTKHHDSPSYVHIVQKNLSLASAIAFHQGSTQYNLSPQELKKDFKLFVPSEQQELVDIWLKENCVKNPILLCPNTTWRSKHWPENHWVDVINLLQKQAPDATPVLVGTTFGQMAKNVADHCQQQQNAPLICPAWDLLTMSHLIKRSTLVIAPDTGLLHLADFLSIPALGIFGPTDKKRSGPFWETFSTKITVQTSTPNTAEFTPQQMLTKVLDYLNATTKKS